MKVHFWAKHAVSLAVLMFGFTPVAHADAASTACIPVTLSSITSHSMPQVMFNHDKHSDWAENAGKDCTACHRMTDDGLAETFLDSAKVSAKQAPDYMHKQCVACHVSVVSGPTGPRLSFCRSCHNASLQKNQSK